MRSDLPSGTVTFLFTDVEGSTRLLHELGAAAYAEALAEHRRLIREACASEGGAEVDTQGDAFFFAFPTAPGALTAAGAFTETLASGPISVRVGLHTGTPLLTDEGYVGDDVHRAARIAACGHGGQVLVSSSTAQLVETELRDLGEHRLKDLSAPERVYQLGSGDFPALTSLYRTNLPVPATPFLGREHELSEVVSLLQAPDTRLLTLTGPGGTGKTRLALQAAAVASEAYPDGVFWVPLAPLRDPELVLPTLARTLNVTEDAATPLEESLVAHLSGKSLLLLLDNVEHLLPPAAERIAGLRSTNGSCLLVTSRERLRISGEQTWPVPPLAEQDGSALFVTRARAVDPAFTPTPVVSELCAALDELPLAIELAAARTAVFSTEQLLERLSQRLDLLKGERDADPRQQTLRATIEWSHDLLSDDEQRLFARLSVFVGGCTYEAAEEVAGADPDTLQSLLDKSLLRKRDSELGPRYWMLETIREFAAERLAASGEADELRMQHAQRYLELAEEAYPRLVQNAGWLDRVEVEHDNFRAALDHLEGTGATQQHLQLAGALGRYWYLRTHVSEGRRRLETALAADPSRTSPRARALTSAHGLAALAGENAAARGWSGEAKAIYRELDDAWGVAYARYLIGTTVATDGQWEQARVIFEESRQAFRELGDDHFTLIATRALAWMYYELDDVERDRALTQENLELARATGNERMQARALSSLSHYVLDEGRVDDALAMQREALRIDARFGELYGIAHDVAGVAMSLAVTGRAEGTVELVSSIEALYAEAGAAMPSYLSEDNEKALTLARAELGEVAFARAWERGKQLTLDEAVALALGETEPDA